MARITKRLLTVALLISALFSGQVGVSAQEATTLDTGRSVSARSVERRFAIYYWLDRVDIDEHYLDNEWQIAQIRKYLLISPKIDSITISSYASPEGVYERNVWLARKRAEAARRFIVKNMAQRKIPVDLHFIVRLRHKASGAALGLSCAVCFEQPAGVFAGCGAVC